MLQSGNMSLHSSLLGPQDWVFQLEAECLPSKLRMEAGGLHPAHPSLMDPSQQGQGAPSLMNPNFTVSPVLWLQLPEHLLAWASWERKGKIGIRLGAFLCSHWGL